MNTNPKRILLINNQESIANKIKTLITKETKLEIVNNYKKVQQKIEQQEYQLIILNNQIVQRKAICTYIKSNTKTPILILTEKTEFKDIKECLDHGAEYVITKNTDINHLKAIIYKQSY
jgi:DNA-binding response OmpR family regulator